MAIVITTKPEQINEDELVAFVEEKAEEGRNEGLERQWQINIAYLTGRQWISWDKINKRVFVPPLQPGEIRLVSNQIISFYRTELAKLTKARPIMEVIPGSTEEADIEAAKCATKVLAYLWRELDMEGKRFELAMWMLSCGTAFLKTYWDATKGDIIAEDEEGKPIYIGDIEVDVVSPFDLKIDPIAKKWTQVRWVVEEKLRPVDYVHDKYGVEVEPDDGILATNFLEGIFASYNGAVSYTDTTRKIKDGVIVREYWEKPSPKYPNGRHITVAGGKLLQYEENPYRRLPYIPFVHIPIPGRVHGRSIIEDLIPLQREYNKIISQSAMNRDLTFNHRILKPRGCTIEGFTNQVAQIIEYDPARGKPEWMTPPAESPQVTLQLQRIMADMQNIAGQHDVSMAKNPPGVRSGTALQLLLEQDDTKLGPTIHTFEDSLKKWAVFVLELVEKHYTEPRLVRIVGENNDIEVFEFKGSDIRGNRDVVIVSGSLMPESKVARQEFVFQLWDRRIIQDPKTALKLLEFGSIEEAFEEISVDINQAKRENKMFMQGDFSRTPREFENHLVHIYEHNKFRKSDRYEQLDEESKVKVDAHVDMHMAYLQTSMMGGDLNGQGEETA